MAKYEEALFDCKAYIPKWPMKAVSIREAMGSAATAKAAGNAIPSNSRPIESNFNTFLHPQQQIKINTPYYSIKIEVGNLKVTIYL